MAKRWINSADVLVDDQGRVAVLLPAELVQNNRLKVDAAGVTLTADIIDLDVQAITGPPPYARTLADLNDRLEYGLFDNGLPWMATVAQSINDGFYNNLYNQWGGQPWLQTIHYDIDLYLYDWINHRPWLETLSNEVSALRAVLEDVYDAAQHALRTV